MNADEAMADSYAQDQLRLLAATGSSPVGGKRQPGGLAGFYGHGQPSENQTHALEQQEGLEVFFLSSG